MKKIINNLKSSNHGFVALFTVLIASVILAMAVGIANISLKQIVLSGSATDANKSFYAADSGVECALFNDFRLFSFDPANPAQTINCGEFGPVDVTYPQTGFAEFQIDFDDPSGLSCAMVTVDKTAGDGSGIVTSKGTNAQCGPTTTSRTVERVIEVTY
jgi:hypothetical protein